MAIFPGNAINYGGFTIPQALVIGNLQWFSILGYIDITETGGAGPFPVIIEDPQKDRPNVQNLVAPVGSAIATLGLRVPANNTQGKTATLVGTDTATIRLATGGAATGVPILTFSGTTMANVSAKTVVNPNPASLLGAASTHQLYSSAAISSSSGTMRLLAFLQYIKPIDLPSIEYATIKEAPIYSP